LATHGTRLFEITTRQSPEGINPPEKTIALADYLRDFLAFEVDKKVHLEGSQSVRQPVAATQDDQTLDYVHVAIM